MRKLKGLIFRTMAVVFVLSVTGIPVWAADFPTKPITLVNPMSPGGTLDLQARAFAALGEKLLGQPVVVTNKPGATGMIALAEVANAPPDGYTLFVGASTVFQAVEWEIVNGRKPTATGQDLVAIGAFTLSPTIVAVPYNSPWKTLADLIKDCKAKPDHYSFSSGGLYGSSHIPSELLMRSAGFKARHVPYKGGGPALAALVGGHVDFHTPFPPTSIPLYRGNKIRLLAIQSDRRLYDMLKVTQDAKNKEMLGKVISYWLTAGPNFSPLVKMGIPLHPGAVKFWKDQGQGEKLPANLIK